MPNSTYTDAIAINEEGAVTGYFGVQATGLSQGFLRSASGKITILSYPGQSATFTGGINDFGVIAGSYGTSTVGGFLYRNGHYQNVLVKGQPAPLRLRQ